MVSVRVFCRARVIAIVTVKVRFMVRVRIIDTDTNI